MSSRIDSVDAYLAAAPEDRQVPLRRLRETILARLPAGFEEVMQYGMVSYVVPHSLYPAGYHCDPRQPLPFMGFASQKNHISVYHMGLYAHPGLLDWFVQSWQQVSPRKPDMGKGCIRFKKPAELPFDLIGDLVARMTPAGWISVYEDKLRR